MATQAPTNSSIPTPSHFNWDDDVQSEINSGNLPDPTMPSSLNDTEISNISLHVEPDNTIQFTQKSSSQDFSEELSSDITNGYELSRQPSRATDFNFGHGRHLYEYEEYPMRGKDHEGEEDEDDYVLETTHYNFITDSPDKKYSIYLAESYLQTRVNEVIRDSSWYRNTKEYTKSYLLRTKRIHDINERRPEYKTRWPNMWKVDIDKPTKSEEWKTYKVRNRVRQSFLKDDNNNRDGNESQSSILDTEEEIKDNKMDIDNSTSWNNSIDPALLDTPYPSAPSSDIGEDDISTQLSIPDRDCQTETEDIDIDIPIELSDTEDDDHHPPPPQDITAINDNNNNNEPEDINPEETISYEYLPISPTSSISSDTTDDTHMSASDSDLDDETGEELRDLGFQKHVATFGKTEAEFWEKATSNKMGYFERRRYTGCEVPSPSRYCYTVIED